MGLVERECAGGRWGLVTRELVMEAIRWRGQVEVEREGEGIGEGGSDSRLLAEHTWEDIEETTGEKAVEEEEIG